MQVIVVVVVFFGGEWGGLLPIGEESGAIFFKQTQSVVIRK